MSTDTELQRIRQENDQLRQRVAELDTALHDSRLMLNGIVNNSPAVIYVKNPNSRLLLVNRLYAAIMGRDQAELVGKTEDELFPPELVASWRDGDRHLFATGKPMQVENVFTVDGEQRDFITVQFPIYDAQQQPYAICGISTDVTDLKRSEREREALQNQMISTQQATLRQLSTPLIPLAEGIVLMPLIGSMDGGRAEQVIETLLEGVVTHAALIAILDITGLPVVDSYVAGALLQVTQAVKLLGAEVVLTGIGPNVAQTLIGIGADLSTIVTPGTLQSGIAYALQRRDEI